MVSWNSPDEAPEKQEVPPSSFYANTNTAGSPPANSRDGSSHTQHFVLDSTDPASYRAPELVLGWDHDYAVDWWSFGLVLHWICTGRVSASQIELCVRNVSCDGHSTPSWMERKVGIRQSCAA